MWKSLEHKKCNIPKKKIRDNLCSYCLARSCVVKLNWLSGGKGIKKKLNPKELETIIPGGPDENVTTMLYDLLTKIIEYCPDVSQKIITNLACTDCSKEMFGDNEINYFWDLTKNNSTQKHYKQNEDVNILLDNLQTYIYTSHENKCNGTSRNLNLNPNPNILFLNSDIGMKLRLSEAINFMGKKSLKCKAVITSTNSYFRFNDQWYQVGNETNTILEDVDVLSDVRMVSYEADTRDFYKSESQLVYQGAQYEKIRNLGDRHKQNKKNIRKDQTWNKST